MADEKNWFTQNAPKASGGNWFAQNSPSAEAEIPDAAAQAHEKMKQTPMQRMPMPSEEVFKPQQPGVVSPGARGGYLLPSYDSPEEAKGGAKQATIGLTTMGAGSAASGLRLAGRMAATGVGAAAGDALGDIAGGDKPSGKEALSVGAGAAATVGIGAGIGKLAKYISPKIDPLAKINKLLGVGSKEVIPGRTPDSLDEFVANPARGALKAGLDEKALAKMNPMERNSAIMAARDKAGAQLDKVLQQAKGTVNVQQVVDKTFKEVLDPKLAKQAGNRLVQILQKNGINKPLSQLTPMEARTVQRSLDDFAKFAGQGEAKSFGDIARQLRKGISAETRKVVPDSAAPDQDYTDLVNASKATQKQLKKFASEVPENKLRKWLIGAAASGAGIGGAYGGYEAVKRHFSTPVP